MSTLIDELTREQLKQDIPQFDPGDTVRVHVRVREGERERTQVFEGVVLKRRPREFRRLSPSGGFRTESASSGASRCIPRWFRKSRS